MGIRQRLQGFVESAGFSQFITGVILINAVLLGMETSPSLMDKAGPVIVFLASV